MKKIALTGNIGSGKTTVSHIFNDMGIPVFNSDNVAKEMLYKSKDKIVEIFGNSILSDENIDTKALAKIVFNDKSELKKITDITHPMVVSEMENFFKKNSDKDFVIVENAVLFESNSQDFFDYIITVTVNEETRIKRVMSRDKSTKEEVEERLKNQLPESYKIENSDFIIFNNDGDNLEEQVKEIISIIFNYK